MINATILYCFYKCLRTVQVIFMPCKGIIKSFQLIKEFDFLVLFLFVFQPQFVNVNWKHNSNYFRLQKDTKKLIRKIKSKLFIQKIVLSRVHECMLIF